MLGRVYGVMAWFIFMKQTIPLIDYFGGPLLLSIPSHAVFRLAMLPVPLAAASWAKHHGIGLLHWVSLPGWVAIIASFLLMDYAYWWWHWANHMVPLFWRFHNVYHTDLDMDVSTASRFHFGEMVFSIGFLALCSCAPRYRADDAADLPSRIRRGDAVSSLELAPVAQTRARAQSHNRHAADARHPSLHRGAGDELELGHDLLLVG
jgi:hypothetical protein